MATDDDDKSARPEPKVKDLLERDPAKPLEEFIDAATAAELARWFGLPSFEQVGDQLEAQPSSSAPTEDPDVLRVREKRANAIAAVDPGLLEALRLRAEGPKDLLRFEATIETRVDPSIALLDLGMIERTHTIAEPREIVRPEDIEDQLKDATPQALLRDLHRAEIDFDKTFEVVDMAASQTIDIVAEVALAMATSWKLPELGEPPGIELRKLFDELRAERRLPWADIPSRATLPNRRVTG